MVARADYGSACTATAVEEGRCLVSRPCSWRLASKRRALLIAFAVLACSLVLTALGVEVIGKAIAAASVRAADVEFRYIDVGAVSGSQVLHPRILGRVARPSPFDAVFFATKATIETGPAGARQVVGTVWLPRLEVRGGQDLDLNISVRFEVENARAFGAAGKAFVAEGAQSWRLQASVDVYASVLGFIPIWLRGLRFEKGISLQGMSGFDQALCPITMERMTSAYGRPGVLMVGVEVSIMNPSYMAVTIGTPMTFNVTQRGKRFGVATVEDLRIEPGRNVLPVHFELEDDATNRDAVEAFVLAYIRADAVQPVQMLGTSWSTGDTVLKQVLNGLDLRFNFKPPRTAFIRSIEANVGFSGLSVVASIFNPLPAAIVFDALQMSVREKDVRGAEIFSLDTARRKTHVPGQVMAPLRTTPVNISLSLLDAHLSDVRQLARLAGDARRGAVVVGVEGPVTITVAPSFRLTVKYSADGVACLINCPLLCRRRSALGTNMLA